MIAATPHRMSRLLNPDHLPVPPVVIAPMVNQSELAFRLLARKLSGNRRSVRVPWAAAETGAHLSQVARRSS